MKHKVCFEMPTFKFMMYVVLALDFFLNNQYYTNQINQCKHELSIFDFSQFLRVLM